MDCTDPLPELDDETFALKLQLQEIENQRALQTRKWPQHSPLDSAVAFDTFAAELRNTIGLVEDHKLAHSIAQAVHNDHSVIEELKIEDTQCLHDRDLALSLNEGEALPPQDVNNASDMSVYENESVDWDYIMKNTECSEPFIKSSTTVAGPSRDYAIGQQIVLDHFPQLKDDCTICADGVYSHASVRLACNDLYCRQCLTEFLKRVIKDETLFPPRCCRQRIDNSIIEANLTAAEWNKYQKSEEEFSSHDRLYCANPGCAKFISATFRTVEQGSCEYCQTKTCVSCKSLAHEGPCAIDKARQEIIEFAKGQGWQLCFGCGEMVSRLYGCNHMTCRCKAEFCYTCGVKWKDCQCGDWDVDELDRRAQHVVDREARGPLGAVVGRQRVAAMARELRQVHECNHGGSFTKVEIGKREGQACETCMERHWLFLMSCNGCHMRVCLDCRKHRF